MIGLNNKKIGFIVDSSSNINDKTIDDIKSIPLGVTINNGVTTKTYKDGIDFAINDLKVIIDNNGGTVKTSQASMPDMLAAATEMCKKYDEVFVFPIHHKLSGNFNTWNLIKEDFPNLHIIMTCDIGASFLWTIEEIKEYLKENECIEEEVKKFVETKIIPNRVGWLMVEDLNFLVKGGRISAIKATFAKLLKIKPIVLFDKNGLSYLDKAKSYSHFFKICNNYLSEKFAGKKVKRCILYLPHDFAGASDKFIIDYKHDFNNVPYQTSHFPTVIVSHTGLKYVAIYFELKD